LINGNIIREEREGLAMPERDPFAASHTGTGKNTDSKGRIVSSPRESEGVLEDRSGLNNQEFSQEFRPNANEPGSPDSGENYSNRNF
jgi:hypothetical protein